MKRECAQYQKASAIMKNKKPTPTAAVDSPDLPTDTNKLVSLLALATGAVVMPQTGTADIIYTDLSSGPVLVGYAGSIDSFLFNLPGTAKFGFERKERVAVTQPYQVDTLNYRTVIAGNLATGLAAAAKIQGLVTKFAAPQQYAAAWTRSGSV